MKKIGLFYAPQLGSTENVAKQVIDALGEENVDLILITDKSEVKQLEKYDKLIFGISTVGRDHWDSSYTKVGWDFFLPQLDQIDLSEKTIAIFGLGNHITYPDHFVDSMGALGKKVIERGGVIIGQCETSEYEFSESDAIVDDKFIGLAVDEDNDDDLTPARIQKWIADIKGKLL